MNIVSQLNLNQPYPKYAAKISFTGLISILVTGPLVSIIFNNFCARLLEEPKDIQPLEKTFDEIVRMLKEYYDRESFNSDGPFNN